MKRLFPQIGLALFLVACSHPTVELVDFETFHVMQVNSSDVVQDDGSLNPEVQLMEDPEDGETKVARTDIAGVARNMLGVMTSRKVIHIAGTYKGHDVDGVTPLIQSGKLFIPASGPIKNLVLVSHYTVAANYEAPSETFPIEGILAAKGYAVAIADYIGYGITKERIHPYMHTLSTAQSVVDMGLAVKPYLEHIGRAPESEKVILVGYSQGGSNTLAVMNVLQEEYSDVLPVEKVYAGAGPYDLADTFDISMQRDKTGIPSAIPMIAQGINEGEKLGLDMRDFFKGNLLEHYDEWINSKQYTVKQINKLIGSTHLSEIMTEEGRDKTCEKTARLYKALKKNSVLTFMPEAPVYLYHSRQDDTVPFENSVKAESFFEKRDIRCDFGDYGHHTFACVRFILTVYNDL